MSPPRGTARLQSASLYAGAISDPPGEAALVVRVMRGDREALGELYSEFAPGLYAAAFRLLGERSDAEDVTHEMFARLPQLLAGWDASRGALGPWLRRVAVRLALMRLRSGRRRREVDVDAVASLLAPAEEPHERLTMADALGRLAEEQRVVFLLKEVEGYSHAEIATLLDISVRNSEVRLFRARQALRAFLGSRR
ncbi:MAG: RNA polymerase sigma factor [Gemmatimonadaceae bacterium]|nr:RNA polymerase sigma factor [Gemmatimonadaceae bacterium]NUQ91391.1 RNA polymerase sigma factor [Gemmatimonadaceae bacterium]NUR20065.1 RNA polymerase sigma factor [Gemmatimonadaceae bacterium]NUS96754.1 RNA polymerase sigma factor [Gemmatimonadaceae bacterium]